MLASNSTVSSSTWGIRYFEYLHCARRCATVVLISPSFPLATPNDPPDFLLVEELKGQDAVVEHRRLVGYAGVKYNGSHRHDGHCRSGDKTHSRCCQWNWSCSLLHSTVSIWSIAQVAHWRIRILWTSPVASHARILNIPAFSLHRPCDRCG